MPSFFFFSIPYYHFTQFNKLKDRTSENLIYLVRRNSRSGEYLLHIHVQCLRIGSNNNNNTPVAVSVWDGTNIYSNFKNSLWMIFCSYCDMFPKIMLLLCNVYSHSIWILDSFKNIKFMCWSVRVVEVVVAGSLLTFNQNGHGFLWI